jgi:hypothetical protein
LVAFSAASKSSKRGTPSNCAGSFFDLIDRLISPTSSKPSID